MRAGNSLQHQKENFAILIRSRIQFARLSPRVKIQHTPLVILECARTIHAGIVGVRKLTPTWAGSKKRTIIINRIENVHLFDNVIHYKLHPHSEEVSDYVSKRSTNPD
jgi:hypothetical protein